MEEKIMVTSKNIVINEALEKVDKDISEQGYARKDAIHIRLIAEEMLGMLKAMAGNYTALIWIEKKDNEASVNISAKTDRIDLNTKKELLAVSTSGKNASSKGFMGKLGDMIENAMLDRDEMSGMDDEYNAGFLSDDQYGEISESNDLMAAWSLAEYRRSIKENGNERENVDDVRDILEKSIVAKLAKDVVVGVKKDKVDMTIRMELKGE